VSSLDLASQIFPGRGEMAGLIRTKDWSKTPLGPIESWPQSLRTAVSICLGSRHPIVLWWGPERWMFYNDAYRPMLGETKHPQFLGASGRKCWAEIWDVIGPMMDQVIETGEATWSEDLLLLMLRHGYLEETYFTFSYSPIRDDTGRPCGIFNACTESTARVLGDRRMRTLREMSMGARTADEAAALCAATLGRNTRDVPFCLVYLVDRSGKHLVLAGHAGLHAGTAASPLTVALAEPSGAGWPLARVARTGARELVDDLVLRFDCVPRGPWGEAPHRAMVLPLGGHGGAASGVLVLGISPRRAFDDDYLGFFELTASHVASAVATARAYEVERERAETLADLDRAERRRVLVVDDNGDMREYIARVLKEHYVVDSVGDGEAALARIQTIPPDLVLSDVMMPRMGGFALLRALRASPATRGIPVILVSARAGDEAVVEDLEMGADDYLFKPFSAGELLTRIRSHLDTARDRHSALRASETRFRRLAESGIVGITVSDASGHILEANAAFLAMVGYSSEDLRAGRLDWRSLASPELATAPEPHEGGAIVAPRQREFRKRDGRCVPALVAVAPLEGGESMTISLDLSERKRLEEQFRQAQKMEAVGRLAGGIAHDFNNMLTVIISYAEMIFQDLGVDEPLRADIDEIRTAGRRATDLTRQLLAFSRQQVLEPKVLDLNQTVAGMEKMLRRLLGADIELTTLPSADLGFVRADPGQVEQIVMNLAVNSRDAMPKGGRLTIQTADVEVPPYGTVPRPDVPPGAYVMLAVTDTGVGMDSETQARAFEPFFTTKGQGKGTGLGLATVFGIVKQSGGHVVVESGPGRGTTFTVYLPKVVGEPRALSTSRPTPETNRGNETILLVEDDDQVRALAGNVLRRQGYVVLEAPSAGEALLVCEQHASSIHLLLSDVILPRMRGPALAERVVAMRPETMVLFMSGYVDDESVQQSLSGSDVAYLQKPLTPASLTQKVREVLDGGRERALR
jgi:PAS domain S-box-containing protein